jgi:hypothetical protein
MNNSSNKCINCESEKDGQLFCPICQDKYEGLSERKSQTFIAKWLTDRDILFTHVPNGAYSTAKNKRSMKHQGMKKGCPDFLIFSAPKYGWNWENSSAPRGIAIELKTTKAKTSKFQDDFINRLKESGWIVCIVNGHHEAISVLKNMGYNHG